MNDELAPLSAGALLGAIVSAWIASWIRPLFHTPAGGVGFITVHHYPKDWDYAVVALLVIGSCAGAALVSVRAATPPRAVVDSPRPRWLAAAIVVFLMSIAVHDLPYAPLDFFHEGEHLTPAFLMRAGGQPYGDVFFHHGFASDGGLDLLVLGDPPSPVRSRRLTMILGAATLALLAPIAAEVCATSAGVAAAVFAAWCAAGASAMRLFPYYRLAPLLIALLGLLRYLRTRRTAPLAAAMIAAAAGVVWSIDVAAFAIAATAVLVIAIHATRLGSVSWAKIVAIAMVAAFIPIAVLLAVHADLRNFFVDSFVTLPRAASVAGSLPAPGAPHVGDFLFWLADLPGRYYVPLVVYGLVLASAFRRWRGGDRVNAARIVAVTTFALVLFRSVAGRVDVNHLAFAMPLLGIIAVAFILEPLAMRGRMTGTIVATIVFILALDVVPQIGDTIDALREWPARHRHDALVELPLRPARDLYGSPQLASDLASLDAYVRSFGPRAEILDVGNNRALYYLLERKAPVRSLDVMMWSSPPLFAAEMPRLRARPPSCVILDGYADAAYDGLTVNDRVPELAHWIDANYPRRVRFGRFIVAAR